MMLECIKEGFNLANKNLQLVLIRIFVTVINLIGFFIFLGVPIFAAAAYLGFDLANAKDTLPFFMKNPFEFVSRYLGIAFLVIATLLFYLTFASLIFLYTLSGTLGVIKNAVVNIQYKFSLSSFFKEANLNFSRLFWLISLMLISFIMLFIAFIISGGIVVVIMQFFTGAETSLEMFFSSFIMISIIVLSIIIFLAGFVFIVYSIVALITERMGVIDSIKKAFNFLKNKPEAFLFYIILFVGIIAANFIFFILKIPFSMVPFIAPMNNIVLSLMNALFQGYLAIVVWSSLIIYYVKGAKYPVYSATYEI